jgi:hypothetical protein
VPRGLGLSLGVRTLPRGALGRHGLKRGEDVKGVSCDETTTIQYGFQAVVWVDVELTVKRCSYDTAEVVAENLQGVTLENNSDTMWVSVEGWPGLVSAAVDIQLNDSLGSPMNLEIEGTTDDDDDDDDGGDGS